MNNILQLTNDERIVMELLVDGALYGSNPGWPLPLAKVNMAANTPVTTAAPRRLDSVPRSLISVHWVQEEKLTEDQKRYLGEMMLEKLAGLCLQKVKQLTGDTKEKILERAGQFL